MMESVDVSTHPRKTGTVPPPKKMMVNITMMSVAAAITSWSAPGTCMQKKQIIINKENQKPHTMTSVAAALCGGLMLAPIYKNKQTIRSKTHPEDEHCCRNHVVVGSWHL